LAQATETLKTSVRKRESLRGNLPDGDEKDVREERHKGETRSRRWLGISDRVGRLVSYSILTQKGTVTARAIV
jgi:hypothetical protein